MFKIYCLKIIFYFVKDYKKYVYWYLNVKNNIVFSIFLIFSFFTTYSANLFDDYYLKKTVEAFLFIGSLAENKYNFYENGLYRKCNIKSDSDSLYLYFHGNAEFINNYNFIPIFNCVPDNKNISTLFYEYPGYFNTFWKYKDATIENFIDYSKEIAKEIISFKKKKIYIVGWSLGVWVSLLVINSLRKYIYENDIKVKVVLLNGFYDLYDVMDEIGGVLKNDNIISILFNIVVRKLSKLFISGSINDKLSNFKLIKNIEDISEIKYVTLDSISHFGFFSNNRDNETIFNFFLNNKSNKKIEILMTSARADKITGRGMFKIFKEIRNK